MKYETILEYLQSGSYPIGATPNLKRIILKKSNNFIVKDGLLFADSQGCLKQWMKINRIR